MSWVGNRYKVAPSEGGHADFAPQDDLEDALLVWLRAKFGHVSYERVLSGPGLVNIYHFLREYRGVPEPAWLTARIGRRRPGTRRGRGGAREDATPSATKPSRGSCHLWCGGGERRAHGARGGWRVHRRGDRAEDLPRLTNGTFLDRFAAKGRFEDDDAEDPGARRPCAGCRAAGRRGVRRERAQWGL